MHKAFRLLDVAINLALGVALSIAVTVVLALGIGTATGQYRTVTVLSGSMRPALDPGDVLVERPARPTDVKVGDVITFHPPEEPDILVTHRVTSVGDDNGRVFVETKGDANNAADDWKAVLPADQPVWVEAYTIPRIGYLVVAIRNGLLLKLLVVALPVIVLGMFLRSIWQPEPSEQEACPA